MEYSPENNDEKILTMIDSVPSLDFCTADEQVRPCHDNLGSHPLTTIETYDLYTMVEWLGRYANRKQSNSI